jgi:rhomboid protease GluP
MPEKAAALVTASIIAVNAVVFVGMVATGVSPTSPTPMDLFKWGADFGPATVIGGQWWRLISSAFLHVGFLHIALNMYVLWRAGALAERLFGRAAFLALYLFAAVGGSLASLLWSPFSVTAGASGAIFGVYGALFALSRVARDAWPSEAVAGLQKGAVGFVLYNVMFGMAMPNVSNSAHLGGLATGIIAGWLLAPAMRATGGVEVEGVSRQFRGAALVPVLAVLAWGTHVRITNLPSVKAHRLAEEAQGAMRLKDLTRARQRLDEAIRLDPETGYHYVLRGWVREAADDGKGAISDYGAAIQHSPHAATPLALRCVALFRQSEYERATQDCDAAIARDANNADAWHGRAEVLKAKWLDEEATRAAKKFVQLSPNWSHAHLVLAELLTRNGDFAAAESEIRKAAAVAPNEPENASARADLLLHQGDYSGAKKEADHAVSLAPKTAWVYAARASVFQAQRDLERALADVDQAITLEPSKAWLHNERAWTLLQLGRLPEADASVGRALSLAPASAYAIEARCWIRATSAAFGAARSDCGRALRLLPGSNLDKGMVSFIDGRYADAVAAWRAWAVKNRADSALVGIWIPKAEAAERTARVRKGT